MKIHRLPIVMLGLSLAVAATTNVAGAQTPVPKTTTPIQVAGVTHHVKGSVTPGTQDQSCRAGAVVKVTEYWYAAPSASKRDLALPANAGTLDPLSFNSKPLVQGRVLGSATLTDAADFDVQWSEPASASRKPWSVSVLNGRTGETITVYRLLKLEITTSTAGVIGYLKPIPVIQFFGAETTKDVGAVKLDCFIIGG